jgi:iron(II)-dependent oxidoreductase
VVRAALLAARERTLRLAQDYRAALGPQLRVPHAEELNPPLWELGHVAWFQEWWIARNPQRALGIRADPGVQRPASLLPSADAWYDSSRVAHGTRWDLPLPDSEATAHYLEGTLAGTLELLDALPRDAGDDALYFYRLAVVHEQMHAEAAVYMGQGLGIPLREGNATATGGRRRELELPAQRFVLGNAEGGFAFDNELGPHEVELAPFAIDAEPVTWAAFLPFVEAGGYEDPQWWTPEGRAWLAGLRQRRPVEQPLRQDQFALHLCAHEADAWCRWAGRRLPTEAEWECAALTDPGFRWGQVWEWTASRFEPYPGFAPHPYRDYSQPWFGTRRVLRGASEATAPALAQARYRNFYEPHRRDILAGFRSVRTGDGSKPSAV